MGIGVNEKEIVNLRVYDGEGNSYLIDVKKELDVLVIVVGNNERMNYEVDKKRMRKVRMFGNMERIEYIKCFNLSEIEGWFKGVLEIRFDGVVYYDVNFIVF